MFRTIRLVALIAAGLSLSGCISTMHTHKIACSAGAGIGDACDMFKSRAYAQTTPAR